MLFFYFVILDAVGRALGAGLYGQVFDVVDEK